MRRMSGELIGGCGGNSLFHNPYVFADFYHAVADDVFEALHKAAGPANLNSICLGGLAQPEMQAKITLRDVSAAAANLLRLPMVAWMAA